MVLYIVSTPIGNLKDITYRAIEVLSTVGLIACEDTRQTRKLLSHFNIHTPLTSFYEYNAFKRLDYLLAELKGGKDIALVSDSGTPGISDPGFVLIQEAIRNNIVVTPIPGPSALLSALVSSGLPTDSFVFEGFLPRKEGKLKRSLKELASLKRTVIFYESPHRISKTLMIMKEELGPVYVVIARELSKRFEEVLRGTLDELLPKITQSPLRGEIVVLFHPDYNPQK